MSEIPNKKWKKKECNEKQKKKKKKRMTIQPSGLSLLQGQIISLSALLKSQQSGSLPGVSLHSGQQVMDP
jgi:hypothetical protein